MKLVVGERSICELKSSSRSFISKCEVKKLVFQNTSFFFEFDEDVANYSAAGWTFYRWLLKSEMTDDSFKVGVAECRCDKGEKVSPHLRSDAFLRP